VSEKRKLASNTAYLFINWGLSTLFSIIFWTVVAKTFLPEVSGIVSTATNLVVALSGITLVGLSGAIRKLIPDYLARGQKRKMVELVHFAFKLTLLISAAVAAVIFIFAGYLVPIFNLPTDAIMLVAASLVIEAAFNISSSVLIGLQSMKKLALTNLAGHISKILFVMAFIHLGFSYVGAIFGYFFSFVLVMLFRFDEMFLRSGSERIDSKAVMTNYALPFIIASVTWLLIQNGQYVMLTMLKGTEATGLFTIAMLISSPILVLPSILTSALSPILAQLSVKRNTRVQSQLMKFVFRYTLFISAPLTILIVMFSKNLIFLFSRMEYLPASDLFPIIAAASLLYAACDVFYSSLYAIGKPKVQRNIVLAMAAIYVLLAVPLTIMLSAKGMAIAYALSMLALLVLSYTRIRKFVKVDISRWSVVKILVASLLLLLFIYSISGFVYGLLSVIVFALLGGLLYLFALVPLKFYTEGDLKMLRFFSEKIPVFGNAIRKIADGLSKII